METETIPTLQDGIAITIRRYRVQRSRGDHAKHIRPVLCNKWRQTLIQALQTLRLDDKVVSSLVSGSAVSLLDSFLERCPIAKLPTTQKEFQLFGIAAFLVATKFHDKRKTFHMLFNKFAAGSHDMYKIAQAEQMIAEALHWRLSPVTACEILQVFMLRMEESFIASCGREHGTVMANDLADVSRILLDLNLASSWCVATSRLSVSVGALLAAAHLRDTTLPREFRDQMLASLSKNELEQVTTARAEFRRSFHDMFSDMQKSTTNEKGSAIVSQRVTTPQKSVRLRPVAMR